jgi:hypothetical protein
MIMAKGADGLAVGDLEDLAPAAPLSCPARITTRFFDQAFWLNQGRSPFGWQLVATAVVPS